MLLWHHFLMQDPKRRLWNTIVFNLHFKFYPLCSPLILVSLLASQMSLLEPKPIESSQTKTAWNKQNAQSWEAWGHQGKTAMLLKVFTPSYGTNMLQQHCAITLHPPHCVPPQLEQCSLCCGDGNLSQNMGSTLSCFCESSTWKKEGCRAELGPCLVKSKLCPFAGFGARFLECNPCTRPPALVLEQKCSTGFAGFQSHASFPSKNNPKCGVVLLNPTLTMLPSSA